MSLFDSVRRDFVEKRWWLWLSIVVIVLALDQLTKYWVVEHFQDEQGRMVLYESVEVTSFFRITRAHNCGVAFSIGAKSRYADCRDVGTQRWVLSGFAFLVSLGLAYWVVRLEKDKAREALALSLIIGGALGNVVDRSVLGYVVDFIVAMAKTHGAPQ